MPRRADSSRERGSDEDREGPLCLTRRHLNLRSSCIKPRTARTRILCRFENETIWLTQKLMAELFQKDVRTINEHIQNIFDEGELSADSVIRNFRITASDGKSYDTQHYNLDLVISVGLSGEITAAARNSASGRRRG